MSLRFSQIALETLQRPTTANARISQMAVEAIQRPTTAHLRASQIAVEVISHNGATGTSTSGGLIIIAT